MIKGLSRDESFKKDVLRKISENRLSKFLSFLRCDGKLTQQELAAKIGCTQGRISKIESAKDGELSLADMLDYAKALNLELEIGVRKKNTRYVDMVKYHVFQMEKYLNLMAGMVKGDDAIGKGVKAFHLEAFVNACHKILKSMAKIEPARVNRMAKPSPDHIHLSAPLPASDTEKSGNEKKACEPAR
jgi:transcriptional regulator with XRE-family HTH domain